MSIVRPTAKVREQLETVRKERAAVTRIIREAKASGDQNTMDLAEAKLSRLAGEIEELEARENRLLGQMVSGLNTSPATSELFEEAGPLLEQLGQSQAPIGTVFLGRLQSAEQMVETIRSGQWGWDNSRNMMAAAGELQVPDAARQGQPLGVVPQLRRMLSLLDLIPTSVMASGSFDYTPEIGNLDTALEVADLALKSEADDTLGDATCVARTIAHYLKVSRPQLNDVPTLASSINGRLTYGVLRRLENAILAGDGVGQNIKGILATSGIGSVAFSGAEPLSDLVLDGVTDVLVSDAHPNGVVANPLDVSSMLKTKASGSGERLDSDGAFGTPPTSMWGLPLVTSRVIPQGQALVGDFAQGAELFVREGVNLRASDSDQDDFLRNRVSFLAEGRWGLAVWRPTCFALVHLA